MEKVKVSFDQCRTVCPIDRLTGRMLDFDKAPFTTVELVSYVHLRGLKQGFSVTGTIPEKRFDDDRLERMTRVAVVQGMPGRQVFNLFRQSDLRITIDTPEMDAWEAEVEIDDYTAQHYEEQAKLGNAAYVDLQKILKEMQPFVNDLVRRDPNDWKKVWDYMSRLHSYSSVMETWMLRADCMEVFRKMEDTLRDLNRRKDPNRPEFKHEISEVSWACISFPKANVWKTEPPQP